ncbi:hypothetical protein V5074_23280 [Atlantibacter hermannii]|uniref:hypothetical protein n=1 Tax=Atlantibacter hermannii TaxID=565 RepID=UPI0030763175
MTNETKAFTVRIPAVVYQAIAERAKNEGRSLSYMVSNALCAFAGIDDAQDDYETLLLEAVNTGSNIRAQTVTEICSVIGVDAARRIQVGKALRKLASGGAVVMRNRSGCRVYKFPSSV